MQQLSLMSFVKVHRKLFVIFAAKNLVELSLTNLVPPDYAQKLTYYTHHGYRVLSVAWKKVEVSYHALQVLKRERVEDNLSFLGFIVFENKLKKETIPVIDALKKACIRQVMCTGIIECFYFR